MVIDEQRESQPTVPGCARLCKLREPSGRQKKRRGILLGYHVYIRENDYAMKSDHSASTGKWGIR